MYVAVKGGERAIENAHAWLAEVRRGDPSLAQVSPDQIREQMGLAVARVMAEGSLYDPELAAIAIKQTRGDLIEAVFLMRAYRTTLPRFGATRPVETGRMACIRRISATFKDAPGGQVLGPTFDYTHRLIDFALAAEGEPPAAPTAEAGAPETPHVVGFLNQEGLIQGEPEGSDTPPDLTREPLDFPADRALRLQALTRSDEGFLLGLAYSTQRGYGRTHAFVGELRIGLVAVEFDIPELGFAI
ncbi:MAG: carbon-phosphorus lyase complex subunit PhnI, partial [Pseudomonadota bacterium]